METKKIIYSPSKRIHQPGWIIKHAKDLYNKAIRQNDSSKILYACLELRNCLEMVEFQLIQASVLPEERGQITHEARPKNGINKVNNKIKTLKLKYQIFYKVVCEVFGREGNEFDFSKSTHLRTSLSDYVHTYTRTESELFFNSDYVKTACKLIMETIIFLEYSLNKQGNSYMLQNICITTLSAEDRQILDNWKNDIIKDEPELKKILEKQKGRKQY